MEKAEYFKKIRSLQEKHNKEIINFQIKVAKENNIYKKHDIIQDHYKIIEILEIKYNYNQYYAEEMPNCIYYGPRLTKKLNAYKTNEQGEMYQINVKRRIDNKK